MKLSQKQSKSRLWIVAALSFTAASFTGISSVEAANPVLTQMVSVQMDGMAGTTSINSMTDESGAILGIKIITELADKSKIENVFLQKDLAASKPEAPLSALSMQGREVVQLSAAGFDIQKGGQITIRYLVDGSELDPKKRKYAEFTLDVANDANSKLWKLVYNEKDAKDVLAALILKPNVKAVFLALKTTVGIAEIMGATEDGKQVVISQAK